MKEKRASKKWVDYKEDKRRIGGEEIVGDMKKEERVEGAMQMRQRERKEKKGKKSGDNGEKQSLSTATTIIANFSTYKNRQLSWNKGSKFTLHFMWTAMESGNLNAWKKA